MIKKAKFAIGILALFSMSAMAEVVEYDSAWGENCYPSKDSYAVKLKNKGSSLFHVGRSKFNFAPIR